MADAAHQVQHEFWRPPAPVSTQASPASNASSGAIASSSAPVTNRRRETCDACASEVILGARFCHTCGTARESTATPESSPAPESTSARGLTTRSAELHNLAALTGLPQFTAAARRLGLTTPSLLAFLLGLLCFFAALSVSIIFTARTTLDWQAIQLWRIEWLLASIASFAAAFLLKKSN